MSKIPDPAVVVDPWGEMGINEEFMDQMAEEMDIDHLIGITRPYEGYPDYDPHALLDRRSEWKQYVLDLLDKIVMALAGRCEEDGEIHHFGRWEYNEAPTTHEEWWNCWACGETIDDASVIQGLKAADKAGRQLSEEHQKKPTEENAE